MYVVTELGVFNIEEISHNVAAGFLSFAFHLIPVCIMFSALGFMIFEILIGVINKILVAFMLYIGMGYVSGYFYPKTFFPAVVQRIGDILPSGVAFSYMGEVLKRGHYGMFELEMIGYAVLFLVVTTILRQQKIR